MTEKYLQMKLVDWLKDHGIYHVKIITAGGAGTPDIIACVKGRFVGIECKSKRGKQSELQKYREEKIRLSGGTYMLVNDYRKFIEEIAT